MRVGKLAVCVFASTIALAALVGAASANRLSQSSGTWRATWASVEVSGGFGTTGHCSLTLEGSVHSRTITKTAGALIGYITRASAGPCGAGAATVLTATLPWHIRYASFSGTLPNISSTSTTIIGFAFQFTETIFDGLKCLLTSSPTEPLWNTYNREAGGAFTSVGLGGTIETTCGIRLTVSGTSAPPTVLGGTTRITLTLI